MWRLDSAKMWSLGHFTVPPPPFDGFGLFTQAHWEDQFTGWLMKRMPKQNLDLQIRSPAHRYSALSAMLETYDEDRNQGLIDAEEWHQDEIAYSSTHLGIWSNTVATQLRINGSKGPIYQAEPCEVVLFDNQFFMHKPPYDDLTIETAQTRWFVRFDTGLSLRSHADVKECTL